VIGHQRGGIRTTTTHEHEHVPGKVFQGLWSPREDVGSLTQEFKNPTSRKIYGVEEAKKNTRVKQVDAAAVCQPK
jgi:hypothetical protein